MYAKSRHFLILALGIGIGLSLGLAHGVWADKEPAPKSAEDLPWRDARMLAQVLEIVKKDYVQSLDDHELLQAAIRGMVASLDPYSEYLDADEYDEIKISSSGEYSGVGLEVSMQDDRVVVVAPIDGSPAAVAGIRAGDLIVSIDGVSVNSATLQQTIGRMRGKTGTSVKIGVLRGESDLPLSFTVERRQVALHSVRYSLPAEGYGYIRIAEFSDTTGGDVKKALRILRKRNHGTLRGLVLDLRDDPGGVVEAAVAVADEFLSGGVIVTAKGRTPESDFEMDATPGDALAGAPIVVLVDGGSASAAEIVAGALKDRHRATLMGRRTFGKGSVQTVMALSGDRALKLTTSLYYTPSGISIDHKGIDPDIELKQDSRIPPPQPPGDDAAVRADPQVRRALQELMHPTIRGRPAVTAAASS